MGIWYDSLNKVGLGKRILGEYSSSKWILRIFEFICEGWTDIIIVVGISNRVGTLGSW
jgi:hypothetical protein